MVQRQEGEVFMKSNEETIIEEEVQQAEMENDEAVVAEVVEESEAPETISKETELLAEIDQLKEQLKSEESKYFRVLADYDNFKRRAALDKEALQKYKAQGILTNLLPILDNFERAMLVKAETDEAKSMMEGMDMIYRSLVESLKTEGLVEIEAMDQEFDPNFHQAVMTESDETKASGIVLEELQKGYMLKDRVLRPTMVKVNE